MTLSEAYRSRGAFSEEYYDTCVRPKQDNASVSETQNYYV
jgi:hypothetical protein